jgi:acyl-CoA thioester hydrolase
MYEENDARRDRGGVGALNFFWRDGWLVVPQQTTFRDLDSFGHVNNANYFVFFEWSRAVLWFELMQSRDPKSINFILARTECDFKLQLGFEPIEILVRIGEMRRTSLDFEHEIRKTNGDVAAVGKAVAVLFDWSKQAKLSITDDFRARVEQCRQGC